MSDHIPVLLNEVLEALDPKAGEVHMDTTFGAGGYSGAILDKGANLIATDRDPSTKKFADALSKDYGDKFQFINRNFSDTKKGEFQLDGIVMDLGVSSMQLDQAERGFAFSLDGDLDMRMGKSGQSAKDFINNADEKEIARIIYEYGDEPFSRRIAKNIVEARAMAPINTTFELADIVRKSVRRKPGKIDLATKTFQAIRIYVNDELGSLIAFLDVALSLLKVGGRLVIVSFHSLEDRIVKNYFNKHISKRVARSKYAPEPENNDNYKLLYKKPIVPGDEETKRNPRARSAKLRAAIKLKGGENV